MAQVIYNGCSVIPAPLVSFNSDVIVGGDQRRLGKTYTITINGTLVSFKGSPAGAPGVGPSYGGYNNQFWVGSNYPPDEVPVIAHKMYNIQAKQEALENLFATDGG